MGTREVLVRGGTRVWPPLGRGQGGKKRGGGWEEAVRGIKREVEKIRGEAGQRAKRERGCNKTRRAESTGSESPSPRESAESL